MKRKRPAVFRFGGAQGLNLQPKLWQMQFAVLRNHDLMAFATSPIEYAQNFMHIMIGIDSHAAVVDHDEELVAVLVTAQGVGDVREMSCSSVKRPHNVKRAVMPLISMFWIQEQIHMRIFGEAKLLDVSIPMANADEKLFDVTTRGIDAQNLVSDLELQSPVVQKRTHLWSHIDTMAAFSILRRDKFATLRGCGNGKKKD